MYKKKKKIRITSSKSDPQSLSHASSSEIFGVELLTIPLDLALNPT